MARTKQFSYVLGTCITRNFYGNATYWSRGSDYVGVGTLAGQNYTLSTADPSGNTALSLDIKQQDGSNNTVFMGRLLMKFDMSSMPVNAVITQATLGIYIHNAAFANSNFFPIELAVYRVFRVPDFTDANMRYYDASVAEWSRYGMVDGVDYKLTEDATVLVQASELPGTGLPSGNAQTAVDLYVPKFFDVTALAKYVMNTVSRQMIILVTRSNAHQRAKGYMFNNDSGGGGSYGSIINLGTTPATCPALNLTYIDALTFHPSLDDNTIDTSQVIDTTDSGIWLFDALRVGGTGVAKKFWVKNNSPSSAINLAVYSQRSYGSKVPEILRTTVGTGTISDITTVDKSLNPTNYTRTEQWLVTLSSATAFAVQHDNGSFDDPALTDAWANASPATGTVGTIYTDTNTGVSFLISAGGTAFVNGDFFRLRTYEDDYHPGAPSDSDGYLHVAPDSSNAPGTFQPMIWKPTRVTANVAADTVVPVADVSLFMPSMTVSFTSRATGNLIDTRTVTAVGSTTITVNSNITLTSGDYVEGVRVGVATIVANGTFPLWIQTSAPLLAVREVKFPRWRASAE